MPFLSPETEPLCPGEYLLLKIRPAQALDFNIMLCYYIVTRP